MPTLGIDFSSSVVTLTSTWKGKTEAITDDIGANKFSPVFLFKNGKRFYGSLACRQATTNNTNFVFHDQASFIQPFSSQLKQQFHKKINLKVNEDTGLLKGCFFKDDVEINDVFVAAMILTHCHNLAKKFLGLTTAFECTMSVPSYYSIEQKLALIKAAKFAGFEAPAICDELTAAMVNHVFFNPLPAVDQLSKHYLACKWGQSCLQIGLFQVTSKTFTQVAGDSILIGKSDIDQKLANYIIKKAYGDNFDLNNEIHKGLYVKIMQNISDMQDKLDNNQEFDFICQYRNEKISESITVDEYFEMIKPESEQIYEFLVNFLNGDRVKEVKIDRLLLPGFGTRAPIIQKNFDLLLPGIERLEPLNLERFISEGCLLASCFTGNAMKVRRELKFYTSHAYNIGVTWYDPGAKDIQNSTVITAFKHGEAFPSEKVATIICKSDVLEVKFFYEGENPFSKESTLAVYKLSNIPVSKQKSGKLQLKAKIAVDSSGIVKLVSASYEEEKEVKYKVEVADEDESEKDSAKKPDNELPEQQPENGTEESSEKQQNESEPTSDKKPPKSPEKKKKTKTVTKTKIEKHLCKVTLVLKYRCDDWLNGENLQKMESSFTVVEDDLRVKYGLKDDILNKIDAMVEMTECNDKEFMDNPEKVESICDSCEKFHYMNALNLDIKQLETNLSQVNEIFLPLHHRITEFKNRPQTFAEIQQAVDSISTFIAKFQAKDESVSHILDEEIETLMKILSEKQEYFTSAYNHLNGLPKSCDPQIKIKDLKQALKEMLDKVMPIMTKPAPVVETPVDEKENKDSSKSSTEKANQQQSHETDGEKAPEQSVQTEVENLDMEVDKKDDDDEGPRVTNEIDAM